MLFRLNRSTFISQPISTIFSALESPESRLSNSVIKLGYFLKKKSRTIAPYCVNISVTSHSLVLSTSPHLSRMGKRERKAPRSLKKASQPDISESIAEEATPGPPVLPKLTLQLPKQPSPSPSLQEDSDPPITPPPPFTADKAQVRDIVNAILGVQKKNSTISISSDSEATSTLSKATSKRKGAVSDISTASTQPGLDEGEDEVSGDEPDEEEDELDEEDNEPSGQ